MIKGLLALFIFLTAECPDKSGLQDIPDGPWMQCVHYYDPDYGVQSPGAGAYRYLLTGGLLEGNWVSVEAFTSYGKKSWFLDTYVQVGRLRLNAWDHVDDNFEEGEHFNLVLWPRPGEGAYKSWRW